MNKPAAPIAPNELNENCFFELIIRTDQYYTEDNRAYSEAAALAWLNELEFTTEAFKEDGKVYPFAEVLFTYADIDGSGLSSINLADKTARGNKKTDRFTKAQRTEIRETIANEVAPAEQEVAPAAPAAEYHVYFNPTNEQVEKYGFTNCIEDAFVRASTDEEAVALAGPMSRLVSVTRLADVDAGFGPMSTLQVQAAKRIIREQMSRNEVTRTSFDHLVGTIDGHEAVEFLETNFAADSNGAYHFRGGLVLKIYWAGQSSGYAGSKVWKVVRTFTPKPEGVTLALWNREQDRYSCEESILKAKGADVLSLENVGPYSAVSEYVTIHALKSCRLFKFNGQRARVLQALGFGKVTVETANGVKDCLLSDEYKDRSRTLAALEPAAELSTLHGVAYTAEEQAVEGDIVCGPVTLYKVASFNWNPKAARGTLDAWRTVREMLAYYDRRKTAPNGYLFRITVAEFEVVFLSGDMKGMCCFWNQHVTDVRKAPYSASLLAALCDNPF